MAVASNPLETFIWGAGGQKMSPEQVARQREIAAALMQGGMDYSPVGHWTQGLARASQGLVGGLKDRWAGEAEQRGREGFQSQWDSVFGGSASPVAAALSETTPAIGAANQMAGAPVTDWLEYANQGATRNQPLAPELVNAMSFLPEMGVTMRVVSGGQDAKGANRVGSTRHDHGNAGDVDFYQNGRKLDWNNEADLPILSNIVSQARDNGVTGIGAGDDYMGAGRLHIGFGNEAVWGAGGKSENAPDWLRAAYSGAPSPARTQVAQAGGGNPSVAQLLSLAGNEWANPGQSSVVSALLGQAMQQQDPRYQQQLALGDLQRQQVEMELERLRNPAAPAPDFGFIELPNGQIVRTDATSGNVEDMGQFGTPAVPSLINAGNGQLYNQATNEWITAPASGNDDLTDTQRNLSWRAQEAGLAPGTPEYAEFMRSGGQSSGMALTVGPDGSVQFAQGGAVGKPLSETQSKDAVYFTRASGALPVIDQLEQSLLSYGEYAANSLPAGLGNFLQSEDYQVAQNAGKEFLASVLRKDTGAAVTPSEENLYGDIFLPRPGDKPATLGRKRQARALALNAIEAGMPLTAIENAAKALVNAGIEAPNVPATMPQPEAPTLTQEQFNAAPSGTVFKAPDGSIRVKP